MPAHVGLRFALCVTIVSSQLVCNTGGLHSCQNISKIQSSQTPEAGRSWTKLDALTEKHESLPFPIVGLIWAGSGPFCARAFTKALCCTQPCARVT